MLAFCKRKGEARKKLNWTLPCLCHLSQNLRRGRPLSWNQKKKRKKKNAPSRESLGELPNPFIYSPLDHVRDQSIPSTLAPIAVRDLATRSPPTIVAVTARSLANVTTSDAQPITQLRSPVTDTHQHPNETRNSPQWSSITPPTSPVLIPRS